jgi:hypothetical protein
MRFKSFGCFAFLFLVLTISVFAQDENFQSVVDNKVGKMKIELNLTDDQAEAVKPVIKEFLVNRAALLDQAGEQGIVDHVSIKSTLKSYKDKEYKELSKILSEDQLKKLINKDNLMATLNPDSAESRVDEDAGLTTEGANFKF